MNNNFFESFPYLQQMNDQFRRIFGDDFMKNLMSSMQSQGFSQGQPGYSPIPGMPGMPGMGQGDRFQQPGQGVGGQSNAGRSGGGEGQSGDGGASPGQMGPMGAMGQMWNPFASAQGPAAGVGTFPMVDILETRHEVVLILEVPGLERASDVRISVFPEQITVKGELHRTTSQKAEYSILQSERRLGQFERTIRLPMRVRKQHAKAVYQQGLLEIRLLKEGKSLDGDGTVIDIDFS